MSKIIARQTCIHINDYDIHDCLTLENSLSIFNNNSKKYTPIGMRYNSEDRILSVPRGFNTEALEKMFLTKIQYDYSFSEFDYIDNIKLKVLPRDEDQKQAIRFMCGEGEYINNKSCPSLSVNLNTGKGKTYCSVATMGFLAIKTIIITTSVGWLNQWKDCIKDYTNLTDEDICLISGSGGINRLFKENPTHSIYLVTHSTLKSFGDKFGWNMIRSLFEHLKIGIKIYDEAHLNFDNMVSIDFNTNIFRTYYVTATPNRSDEKEDMIFQKYISNIKSIDLFDINNDPRTKYIALRYNSRPTANEITECKGSYGLDRNKYTQYILNKENFYKILDVIMNKINKLDGKTLIYIGTNQAILAVKEWIIFNYPKYSDNVGVYTSIIKDNKKEQLDKKIILSTTKSCGAASDIKGLEMTVVLAEPFKSKITARQTLGRTRSDNTLYVDVIDEGFIYLKRYYVAKQETFNKYASSCTEIRIKDAELDTRSEQIRQDKSTRLIVAATVIGD